MVEAFDKLGQPVYVSYTPDCCENEDGYYCEVWADKDIMFYLGFFCVHPDDCDCSDSDAVDAYIRKYVAEECEFDLGEYRIWMKEFCDDDD